MNKLDMAHDWAMKNGNECALETVMNAWEYADLMQEQADLRAKQEVEKQSAELRSVLSVEEWQPDWSQAPDNAHEWRMFGDFSCVYYDKEGLLIGDAPDFNYKGNWIDSLRKRP